MECHDAKSDGAFGQLSPSPSHIRRCWRWRWRWTLVMASLTLLGTALLAVSTDVGESRGSFIATDQATTMERHFATKTMYWDQRFAPNRPNQRLLRRMPASLESSDAAAARGLRLVQTQLVTRHGIRYPTLGPIRDLEALIEKLRPVEARLPRWLRGYKLQYNASVQGQLASSGVDDMERFARRQLAEHGRRVARASYSAANYQISHTHVSRTKHSAMAFADAYFENPHDIRFIEHPKHNDTLLRFFDVCERYQREVKRNSSALAQLHAFANSTAMRSSRQLLVQALGVDPSEIRITEKDLAGAFSACAFDVALYGIRDQWCSLFTPEMVTTLDYYDDLKAFYQLAGGYPINYQMAAVLLQDVVAVMESRIRGASTIAGAFRFAHAETTLPLMTLLGYGTITPLKATASANQIHQRGFRTSALAPFAANIEFRLYERRSEDADAAYFVQMLVNERDDVALPGCGQVFCPLTALRTRIWRAHLEDFDFARQCQ